MTDITDRRTVTRQLQRNWGWLLALGIIFLILGIIALSMLVGVTLVSMLFLGVFLIIAGIFQIADTVRSKQWQGAIWHALGAILYIAAGIIMIYDPLLASTALTGLLAAILIIMGTIRIVLAFSLRGSSGWKWLLFAGLLAIVLGILILAQWPWSGLWVIGLFIAVDLIITGWTYIFLSLALRDSASKA